MAQPVVHFEIVAEDYEGVAKFYSDVFGWNMQPVPGVKYANGGWNQAAGLYGAGINSPENTPDYGNIILYIGSDDLARDMERIVAAGGRKLSEPDVTPFGTWQFFADPAGNKQAIYLNGSGMPE